MSALTVALFTVCLILITALIVAAAAGKLARLDGATYPAACLRAAAAFAAFLTLAAAITAALAAVLT
ncbi:hypothetical protein ACIBEA_41220 [Streptomyces sp. NPDC051555]|uniref:hypothetical protein n=1 Tax=Streptomyces sp. NPDC051555 TaxID=3365657 RepID=UPI0037AEC708